MTRARWIVLGVVLLVLLGFGVLFWFNMKVTSVGMTESNGRRTWTIEPGDNVTLNADEVRPDDHYRCQLDGSSFGVSETPAPGGTGSAGPLTVSTAEDGTVTLMCAES